MPCSWKLPNGNDGNATCNPKRRASLFHMWDSKEKSKKSWQQRNTNLDAKIWHCFTSFHHIPPLQGPPAELSPCLTSLVALAASKLYISCWKWMEMDGNGISDCVDHGLPFIHLRPTLWSPVNARYLRDNFFNLLSATKLHNPKSSGYSKRFECIQLQENYSHLIDVQY